MRFLAYILSLTLHSALILGIYFWPAPTLIKLDQAPVLISLVEGDLGGNRAPSPILGPQGDKGQKIAPSVPEPPQKEVPPPTPETAATPIAQPKEEPKKPEPAPKPEPEIKPEPKPVPDPEIAKKAEAAKKKAEAEKKKAEEAKKKAEAEKKKAEEAKKKAEAEKKKAAEAKKKAEAARKKAEAAKKKAKVDPIMAALAEAKRNAGGFGGGGGGEGEGPGGGGLGDVYIGQVMLAVRPNWDFETATRTNWVSYVRVRVDANGNVLLAKLEQSSGNAQYDASTVNAVLRTGSAGAFPAPPGPEYHDLVLVFNLQMMNL